MTRNALRLIAWMGASEQIDESPVIGYYGFSTGSFQVMSRYTLLDFGLSESPLLQLWRDYGFFAPFLMMIAFITIISYNLEAVPQEPTQSYMNSFW